MINTRYPLFYRKPEGGYALPAFKIEQLRAFARTIPGPAADIGGKAYALALRILDDCFGREWTEKHIFTEPKNGFLARPLGDDYGTNLVMHRIRDLAETILNLLPVKGIEAPLDQLVGGQIESAVAELGVGKLFHRRNLPFCYVAPSVKGESFDFLLKMPNGIEVCLDTKCKYEEKAFSSVSVLNSLDDARKRNLPKGRPCVIFLKIPHDWVRDQDTFSKMENTIWKFLKNTKRIVSVQVYASIVDLIENVLNDKEWGWEYVNPNHDFESSLDWRVFAMDGGTLPDIQNWIKLADIVQQSE